MHLCDGLRSDSVICGQKELAGAVVGLFTFIANWIHPIVELFLIYIAIGHGRAPVELNARACSKVFLIAAAEDRTFWGLNSDVLERVIGWFISQKIGLFRRDLIVYFC